MTIDELNRRFAVSGAVAFEPGPGGLPKIVLSGSGARAELALHGAHVLHWQPAGHRPVLWMSRKSWFEADKPIRGGVPICFPWFGQSKHVENAPHHGIVRLREWEMVSAGRLGDGSVQAVLATRSDDWTRPYWPHAFEAKFVVTLGASLTMSLTASNTDAEPYAITEALHTYFAVSDIRKVKVLGLADVPFIDTVGGQRRQLPPEREAITFTGETDRNYPHTAATAVIKDAGWGRKITIAKSGSNSTVVWNPWIDKSAMMPDFGDDEWPGMLCIETANIGPDAVMLQPGASHTLEADMSVEAEKED